jgi:hypothetical protein
MRMGKAIEQTHEHCVVVPKMPPRRRTKLKYALAGIGVALAVLIGSRLAGTQFSLNHLLHFGFNNGTNT